MNAIVNAIADILFKVLQLLTAVWVRFAYATPGKTVPPITNPLLLESAISLAQKIRRREVSSVQVVQSFIDRIKQVNPILNCVVDERFEEALEEAKTKDQFIASGACSSEEMEAKTPFLGVPFTVKLCVSLKGFRNTAGLYCRRNFRSTEDAEVVLLLRKAGAIPIASTNVSELCLWWESFNPVHGRTNNPYNTNHTAGGSSGGEGSVLAAAASPMGLGSDIGGSIRIPASFNGVFGHKPTNGIGSLVGHFPYPRYPSLKSFLVIGPMSRYATDLLPMYKVIAKEHVDKLNLNEKVDITKLRYFFMDDDSGSILVSPVEPEIKLAVSKIVYHFKKEHNITVRRANLNKLSHSMMFWFAKMRLPDGPLIPGELSDGKGTTNVYLEMVKFFVGASNHTLPILATAVLEQIGMKHGDPKHVMLLEKCAQLKQQFQVNFVLKNLIQAALNSSAILDYFNSN